MIEVIQSYIKAHLKLLLILLGSVLVLVVIGIVLIFLSPKGPTPTTFGECAALYGVKEGFPRTCGVPLGKTFVEYTGNQNKFNDGIRLTNVMAAPVVTTSPFVVTGEAVLSWFEGGGLTAELVAGDGSVIGTALATRSKDPVSTGFVGFTVSIPFTRPTPGTQGALVLKNVASSSETMVIPVAY